jgi:hypothetical protein
MITKEQALLLHHNDYIHYNNCNRTVGPRGGVHTSIERYRVASNVKTWVRRPADFEFTVRFGMQKHTYTLDRFTAVNFHIESECPLNA